jgi:hypothetical protein
VVKCSGEVNRRGDRVRQAEESPERVYALKELKVGPHGHRQIGDGLGIRVPLTVGVVGYQPGDEGEDQRGVGELHYRIGTGEAQLCEAPESAPASDPGV